MLNKKENDNTVRLLGTATVKTTILQSRSGKTLEIENRVDPKLWYWTKVKTLKKEIYDTVKCVLGVFLIALPFLYVRESLHQKVQLCIGIGMFLVVLMLVATYIQTYKELKSYQNMKTITDDYRESYRCLNGSFYDYEFIHLLDESSLINFCEKDGAIMFNHIDYKGDYCVRDIKVDRIRKNIHASHTKIIMYENHLECVIPYKLQEKAPEQSGADD